MVYLTFAEHSLAEEVGRARCNAKPQAIYGNDSSYHRYNNDRAYPHILGVAAEVAYARLTDTQLDRRLFPHGDVSDFGRIEVKAATWLGSDIELKVKQTEYYRKTPLAYVLARVARNWHHVEFIGSILRRDFDLLKYERKHKFVRNWCVRAENLEKTLVVDYGNGIRNISLFSTDDGLPKIEKWVVRGGKWVNAVTGEPI